MLRSSKGLIWRAGIVALGAIAFACQTGSEGYEVPGPLHVVTMYVDVPAAVNGGMPGDETPSGMLAWTCQCLATDFQSDGALAPAPAPVSQALAAPEIRFILSKLVQICDAQNKCIETAVFTDAGNYAYLNLTNSASDPVTLTTASGMTDIPLAGYYDPEGSPVTLPPGPSLVVTPKAPLASGTKYTVHVGNLVGHDGVPFQQPAGGAPDKQAGGQTFAASFTTQAFAVIQQMPQDTGMGDGSMSAMAPTNTTVQITFTAAPDPATLTPANAFIATAAAPTVAIPGAWCVGSACPMAVGPTTAEFTPAAALLPTTKYVVNLTTNVKDTGGSALGAPYVGYFTTGM